MRMLLCLPAAAALCFSAVACVMAQEVKNQVAARAEFRISGVVVDATTGLAVPWAELSTTGDVELTTVADSEGRFVFADVEPGKYPLFAAAPGYVKQGYHQHGSFFTGIAVGSGLDSEHLLFTLQRQAVIFGRVTDERGDGVRQATVWLFAENLNSGQHGVEQRAQMQTNDEGGYRFAHLLPGKYYVGVMARPWYAENGMKYQSRRQPVEVTSEAGSSTTIQSLSGLPPADPMFDVVYPVTYFAGATESAGAVPLVTKAGDAMEADVRLIAVPSTHILLTNVDRRGRSGPNVAVFAVQRPFGATQVGLTVTSAELSAGTYEVSGLPPGEVRVMVNRGGEEASDAHGVRVNATEGETVDANSREPSANVSGTVTGADGNKAEMQGEVVLRKGSQEAASARVRRDGTFSFAGVEEGAYQVQLNIPGNHGYVAKVTASGAKVSGKTVSIESASEVKLVVSMGKGLGRVTGIARMGGKPLEAAMVVLAPAAENLSEADFEDLVRMDQSDSDGSFALGGIVPGKYVLMAIEDGWALEWRDGAVLKPYRQTGIKMEVTPEEDKNVTVEGVRAEIRE
jgi:protocatechuate 3,4-dioxygenase beta subunit